MSLARVSSSASLHFPSASKSLNVEYSTPTPLFNSTSLISILDADCADGRDEEESPAGGVAPSSDDPEDELADDPDRVLFFSDVGVGDDGVPPSKDDPLRGVPPRRDDPDTDFVSAVFAVEDPSPSDRTI